jgi:thiol:disulfide interchange protein
LTEFNVMLHKIRFPFELILLSMLLFALFSDQADAGAGLEQAQDEPVSVQSAWSVDRARPGDTVALALVVTIKEGFHINGDKRQIKSFKDFKPYPTTVQVVDATQGVVIETARFPEARPVKVTYASEALMSFEGRTIIYLPMKLDRQTKPGLIALKIELEYQACADKYCLFPKKVVLQDSLSVIEPGGSVSKINDEIFKRLTLGSVAKILGKVRFDLFGWQFSIDMSSGFGWILLLSTAAFGGLLLNFTPCVLPLIPIKIISLSHAAENRRKCFLLGIAMSLGILMFWLALGIIIALVTNFSATNQLFQYPAFTILIGAIIGTMALGMIGFFSLRLPQFIYMINPEQDSLHGSFALGILAAILSTPCTAPFMGAAAAWAATQAPLAILSTFSSIGAGMALPYLILSAAPSLVKRMPKTGPASALIKQVMGMFMLAAATYFIGVGISALLAFPPNPASKHYWWPVMGFCAAGGVWLAYRMLRISSKKRTKVVGISLGMALIGLSAWGAVHLTDDGPINWVHYTPDRFDDAIRDNKVVVMVFTAEWCLNCKALEQSILHNHKIIDLLSKENIVPVKVDITGNNPAGKAKLKEVGRLTVPLLVIFSPDGSQVFKSDFYTVEQVVQAVQEALRNSSTTRSGFKPQIMFENKAQADRIAQHT